MGLRDWSRRREQRVQLTDVDPSPDPPPESPALLLQIAAEAVILQDEAENLLAAVGRHEHLGILAPRAGPVVRRFFALRELLPTGYVDPQLARLSRVLDTVFYHHAMQVATALEFLAVEWRSDRLAAQVGAFGGLGAPAEHLERAYRELRARSERLAA